MSNVLQFVVSFFFSSRRRHTRLQGDWSSDVCFRSGDALLWALRVPQMVAGTLGESVGDAGFTLKRVEGTGARDRESDGEGWSEGRGGRGRAKKGKTKAKSHRGSGCKEKCRGTRDID